MIGHEDALIARYAASTLVNMSARLPGLELEPAVEADVKSYAELVHAVDLGYMPAGSVEQWRPSDESVASCNARASPKGKKEMQAAAAEARTRREEAARLLREKQEEQEAEVRARLLLMGSDGI